MYVSSDFMMLSAIELKPASRGQKESQRWCTETKSPRLPLATMMPQNQTIRLYPSALAIYTAQYYIGEWIPCVVMKYWEQTSSFQSSSFMNLTGSIVWFPLSIHLSYCNLFSLIQIYLNTNDGRNLSSPGKTVPYSGQLLTMGVMRKGFKSSK